MLDTLALLNAKNLGVTSNREFDKEGRYNFREKAQKKAEEQLLRKRVGRFYKNKIKYLLIDSWWLLL